MLLDKTEIPIPPQPAPDERFLLVERIIATIPFQKSQRFRDLLRYLTEKSIHGAHGDLSETKIGVQVFHRPADYSPVEDSTVRVHVRQLRLKLHEFFDGEGRDEPLILEIPKGGFTPVFRPATPRAFEKGNAEPIPPATLSRRTSLLIWGLSGLSLLLAITCGVLTYQLHRKASMPSTLGLLDSVFSKNRPTDVVIGDVNFGITKILTGKQGQPSTLQDYFDTISGGSSFAIPPGQNYLPQFERYVRSSNLTSFADASIISTLASLAAVRGFTVHVRPARELHLRDFENGNFILLGSSASDPWVSLFEDKLNFQLVEDPATRVTVWMNKNPQPGEKPFYRGLASTGSGGEDYADISLLPSQNGPGNTLIIQGMQQEGTEAAGRYLADDAAREQLAQLLQEKNGGTASPYFEALIKTSTVAGAPNVATVVAVRSIPKKH